ncbi:hypothetical protein U3A55_13195 [Salarchaeum sp. III]|uniref:hypothetical protein n=1 Tax=Salarchaeum sp. III TaxID=3107927 RepID=UPI002EDA570C
MSQQSEPYEPLDLPEVETYTHRAHRFPGKFHPPLIAKVLRDHPEHDVVADPMAGSGTLAVEAITSGRDTICNDIDPLSSLITRGKTHPTDPDRLRSLASDIREATDFPERGDYTEEEAKTRVEENLEGTEFVVPTNLLHWFEPFVAVGYSRLLITARDHVPEEDDQMWDAIRTALAAMVRQISRADPEPVSGLEVTKVRREQLEEGVDFDVEQSFKNVSNRLAKGYEDLRTVDDLGNADVFRGDSKNFAGMCRDSGYNPTMVVTSPPYCNAIEYSRRHRLEYEWLGLFNNSPDKNAREERLDESRDFFGSVKPKQDTLRSLDPVPLTEVSEVTAEIEAEGHERKANLLRKYFLDAFDWIEQIHKVLPQGGVFCLIIGPSTSYGRVINTPEYLKEIAERQGFVTESERSYKLVNNKMQYPTNGATTDTETLYTFRVE